MKNPVKFTRWLSSSDFVLGTLLKLMAELRKDPYKKGVLKYYCELKVSGTKKLLGLTTVAFQTKPTCGCLLRQKVTASIKETFEGEEQTEGVDLNLDMLDPLMPASSHFLMQLGHSLCASICMGLYTLSQGERPTSYLDASDGVMASQPASEEVSSKLKRLGYPEVAGATKPSLLLTKAITACNKRLKKLEEFMPKEADMPDLSEPAPDQAAVEPIAKRP